MIHMKYRTDCNQGYSLIEVLLALSVSCIIITANIALVFHAVQQYANIQAQCARLFNIRNIDQPSNPVSDN